MPIRALKVCFEKRRLAPWIVVIVALVLSAEGSAQALQSSVIAFINASVIPLDYETVKRGQTVLVRGNRIVAIGNTPDVSLPTDATIIDCTGQYLVPGLVDGHVHLAGSPLVLTRADFGDAPLYLAYGITTVINLSGSPTILEWRDKVNSGRWLGPTIYTSGPFVNEPRVNGPEEVERDIVAQAQLGYDLIKFHELFSTTTGLSLPAYRRMIETTRRIGLPLIGHAPINLGIDEMLWQRQSIAHMGMLSTVYFLPFSSHTSVLLVTAATILILICLALASAARAIFRRAVGRQDEKGSGIASTLTGWAALATVCAFACAFTYLPGGPLFNSMLLRSVFTLLACFVMGASVMIGFSSVSLLRNGYVPIPRKLEMLLVTGLALALSFVMLTFWVPVSWRSSDRGIDTMARRIHDAGIFVQSTLINYDTFSTLGRTRLLSDPAIELLMPSTRQAWRQESMRGIPLNRLTAFNQKIAGALHRHGVPIIAGTDALGLPLVPPGNSLHRELQLLIQSGFSPFEAMQSATIMPARFLDRANDFGTIAVGKRADLLLVASNPLDDLTVLQRPNGVMAGGTWLPRQQLDELLNRLTPIK